jgi:Tfp pilus assembly protein PilV
LIEVMIALAIMAIVLLSLGGLMYSVARHSRMSAAVSYRSAAATKAAAWAEALPWDTVGDPAWTPPCISDTLGPFSYDRCTSVSGTPQLKVLTIAITPTGVLVALPDTIVVSRHLLRAPSPFR